MIIIEKIWHWVGMGTLLLLLLPKPAAAQVHTLFHDDFTVEAGRWISTDPGMEVKQHAGRLQLERLDPEGSGAALHEVLLRPRETFAFETSLRFDPLGPKARFGLIWNSSEAADRRYIWWIDPKGSFAVAAVENGRLQWLQEWTRTRRFKAGDDGNVLRLEKRGWAWYFMINGKEVLELPYKPFKGNFHGLLIEGQGRLELAYFSIEHPPVDINVVNGPEQNARKARLDSIINQPDRHETLPLLAFNRRSLYYNISDSMWTPGELVVSHVLGDTAWSVPAPLPGLESKGRLQMIQLGKSGNKGWAAHAQQPWQLMRKADSTWRWGASLPLSPKGTQPEDLSYWFLSEDESILLMAANRSGGYGDLDVYVSFREGSRYSKPKNLGNINTYGRETSPWLAPDGETLYFSSEGHPGYGGGDIFRSQRLDNTWTRWSVPENLGPRINGPTWDLGYRPWQGREDRAYMASVDSIRGDFDLYAIRIPEDLRTKAVVRVFGRLLHRKTGQPLGGLIRAQDLSPDSLHIEHNSETGLYSFLLPFGKAYQLFGERIGFFSTIDTLDVRAVRNFREIERDLYVSPIEVGETITLERVFFQRASPLLLEDSYAELDQLVMLLRALPGLEIEIQGHTDNLGTPDELQRLSEARAQTVREYLTSHGISVARIRARGFGATRPIASNANPATRQLNRRVDFNILKR